MSFGTVCHRGILFILHQIYQKVVLPSDLSHLEPKEVFHYFEEICQIPHPSYKEEKISDYCMKFAKEHGLTAYQDELIQYYGLDKEAEKQEV